MADLSQPVNHRMHCVVLIVTSSGCLKLYLNRWELNVLAIDQYIRKWILLNVVLLPWIAFPVLCNITSMFIVNKPIQYKFLKFPITKRAKVALHNSWAVISDLRRGAIIIYGREGAEELWGGKQMKKIRNLLMGWWVGGVGNQATIDCLGWGW